MAIEEIGQRGAIRFAATAPDIEGDESLQTLSVSTRNWQSLPSAQETC